MAQIGRKTENWSSRFAFIMAAVGSAVGLGNFWRFPYMAGENGGGAFIIIYICCVAFVALPLLMAEYAMGRKSGMSAIEGVQSLARAEGRSQNWGIATWLGALSAFFILTFYMVISCWLLAYIIQAIGGELHGADAIESGQNFVNLIGQGETPMQARWYLLFLLALFIGANALVVGRGVKGGLETAATILMPLFFLMLIVVVGFAVANGDTARTLAFLFEPKWEDVGFKTLLAALGQAFFSIGVGVGLMITYGAYLDRDTDIPRASGLIAASDTFVALIAGFAIFPIVFAAGLDPASGPSLFFVSMPVAFEAIPGGNIFAVVFFSLALFAAFTSSISLMEVGVSWLEEREGVTRPGAAAGVGFVLFMIGAAYVFSLDYLDFMDFMTEGLLLPLGGLLMAVFAGWVLSRDMLVSELGEGMLMNVWRFLMRWFVPPFIAIILVFGFLDKIQDQYHVQLPGALVSLLGPNWTPPPAE
ncbi:MAG: sodium-dependent transporter [Hyphomonas sp.]|jgi:NSS family neurotransmitter:Na+ symporter|uniref:sodium-dependent transporter n=1 Tax=Hyphomonas sp. TaxID=87 RepID=UPI0025C1F95D|nr:sodium-dependent transporter [Hyphomonas sp.]MBA4338498.1 sodium-dependent transporter [Hyphomonas sp.]